MEREQAATWWRNFAAHECRGYSPLYEAICLGVAEAPDILDLVLTAPPFGRQPNVLLAAVHDLVLRGVDHDLTPRYAAAARGDDVSVDGAAAEFCDLVRQERDEVSRLLSFRRTNTNECGRSAALVPALRWAATVIGEPVGLLDAGTSAGLNLHLDRYRLDYDDGRSTGPADSPVRIACALSGGAPIEPSAPEVARRIGLDRSPVDLDDADEVRWLLACVWPDTGRLERTRAAIELARRHPVEVVAGDVVDDLAATVERLGPDLPVVVTTSWVLAYLRSEDRLRFVDALAAISRRRDVAWVSAEAPGTAPGIDPQEGLVDDAGSVTLSVLGGAIFRDGALVHTGPLARCHPHGSLLHWTAPATGATP